MHRSYLTVAALVALSLGCESSVDSQPSDVGQLADDSAAVVTSVETPSQTDSRPARMGIASDREAKNTIAAKPSGKSSQPAKPGGGMNAAMQFPKSDDIVFKDNVRTNVEPPQGLDGLVFIDTKGKRVQLGDYVGKKHVVLVFTEGFSKMLCPFCKTQTSRLVANYDKFEALNAEVLVVYPGARDRIDEFLAAARGVDKEDLKDVPFPVVLDPKLEAVDHFDIRSQLAHPSTYVIDIKGDIQLAYVGEDMSPDRPSIKSLLETLQRAEERN